MVNNVILNIAKKHLIEAGIENTNSMTFYEIDISKNINKYLDDMFANQSNFIVIIRSDHQNFTEYIDLLTDHLDIVANIGFTFNGYPWRTILFNKSCLRTGLNTYSKDGSFYDETNKILQSGDIESYKKYLSEHHCENVLEIACGTNRVGKEILSHVKIYDGIDLSPVMLKYSAIKTWEPHASFYCKDMRNFSLPRKYDLVFCAFNSLQILDEKDVVNCLICANSLLSENGKIIIDIFNPKSEFLTIDAVTEYKCSFISEKHDGHLIELYETHQYNPQNRINYIRYTYKDTVNGKSWLGEYSMTQFDAKKMDCFIKHANLIIVNKYGDYHFQPFSDACYKQIFVLQSNNKFAAPKNNIL